jgi:hypothetical protein
MKVKKVWLVQQGYYSPLAFSTRTKALKYIKESGHTVKDGDYYWDSKESKESGDGEFRMWLIGLVIVDSDM